MYSAEASMRMRLVSNNRLDSACYCHSLRSLSSVDHPIHSGARMRHVFTSIVNALDYHATSARQVWDVNEARGWAGQTLTTSSTMLMDS